jgi:hypothetical protein
VTQQPLLRRLLLWEEEESMSLSEWVATTWPFFSSSRCHRWVGGGLHDHDGGFQDEAEAADDILICIFFIVYLQPFARCGDEIAAACCCLTLCSMCKINNVCFPWFRGCGNRSGERGAATKFSLLTDSNSRFHIKQSGALYVWIKELEPPFPCVGGGLLATTSLTMVCTLMMRGGGGPGKINSDSEVGGD